MILSRDVGHRLSQTRLCRPLGTSQFVPNSACMSRIGRERRQLVRPAAASRRCIDVDRGRRGCAGAAVLIGGITMAKFVTTLSSSVRGELERRPAPTRADAFKAALDLTIECLALEVEHQWMHNETVSIRVEADPDAP
jgi:hypothetical protein